VKLGIAPGLVCALVLAAITPSSAPIVTSAVAHDHRKPPAARVTGEDVPAGLTRDDWSQIRRAAAVASYQPSPVSGTGQGAVLSASNARQRYRATFRRGGIELASDGAASVPAWRVGLSVAGYGYDGHVRGLDEADPRADEDRVEYRRGPVTEWYVNRPAGLEQGFELREPEAGGDGPLVVAMAVRGDMDVVARDGGVAFAGRSGAVALRYAGLKAWDAAGRQLGSRVEVAARQIRLLVDARTARFPVTVDPFFLGEAVLVGHGDPPEVTGTGFGCAVSLDQDTVAIGAFSEPGATGTATGAAYIFVRSGGVWSLQQRLVDPDGSTGDQFGTSIALSGDTVVVASPYDDAGPSSDVGSVVVFVRSGGTWTVQQKILASDGASGDKFGYGVGIYGDTFVAGAPSDDTAGASDRGSAYVFVRSGTTWNEQQKVQASDGASDDEFGSSVAVAADTLVAGAPLDDTAAGADAGSAYVFVRSGTTWSEQQKLVASDAAAGDSLGAAVSLNGDTVVAGAPNDQSSQGSAYVFVRSGTTWSEQQKLVASDGAVNDNFGASVAVWGDTVLAGSPFDGSIVGSAYAFVRSGTTWSEQQKLVSGGGGTFFGVALSLYGDTAIVGAHASGVGIGTAHAFVRSGTTWTMQQFLQTPWPTGSDRFARSVSVSGDTAVVGAPQDNTPTGTDAGSAYVFVRTGAGWPEQAVLRPGDAAADDRFASSVAVDGDTVVAGAPLDDTAAGADAGSAYVFVRSGTTWTEQQKLVASDAALGDQFGSSVSISGDTIVVGTPDDSVAGQNAAGSAYVFVRSGTTWTQQQKLVASDGAASDALGTSVSVFGDTAVAGAPGADTGAGVDAGAAYVFVRSGTTWTEQQKLVASDGAASDSLGAAVSLSVDTAVIGAPQGDATSADTGSAYVFVRSGTAWTEQQKLVASDALAGDELGQALSVSGDTVVVGAPLGDAPGTPDAGAAYVFLRAGTVWTEDAKLLSAAGIAADDAFGFSVSLDGDVAVVGAPDDDLASGVDSGSATIFRRYTAMDLGVTKTDGQATAAPGEPVTYAIVVSNAGPDPSTGATVTDTVPSALTGATWTCSASAGSSCTASGSGNINDTVSLLVGGTATYLLTGTVSQAATGTLTNTVTVAPGLGGADPVPANNSATDTDTLAPKADLTIVKSDAPDPVQPVGALVYTLAITNAGPSNATAVTAVDTLPAGVTFVSSVPGPPACVLGGATLTCTLGALAAAANATVTINTTVTATGGILVNSASVTASEPDPVPGNNSAVAGTAVGRRTAELTHGTDEVYDLAAQPGPVADEDVFRMNQKPYSSYEVVIDATSGDIGGASGPILERLGGDGTTILQGSVAIGTGSSRSLRWANTTASEVEGEAIRVKSAGCTTDCGPDDVYRIRAYETTYAVPRFNNAGTQVTVLVLQNPTNYAITGQAYFRTSSGALVGTHSFTLSAKAALVLNTATVPGANGVSGGILVAHDGRYGDLVGKTVALEPATGFSFDSGLEPRASLSGRRPAKGGP
jgi:uncharacterized repeat protein (TIGR01451 family)